MRVRCWTLRAISPVCRFVLYALPHWQLAQRSSESNMQYSVSDRRHGQTFWSRCKQTMLASLESRLDFVFVCDPALGLSAKFKIKISKGLIAKARLKTDALVRSTVGYPVATAPHCFSQAERSRLHPEWVDTACGRFGPTMFTVY